MYDLSQLEQTNDIVQRLGISDKRKRNQAIRAGLENPNQFQQENSAVIQEAQQPSEFWGAGRKMSANQDVDQGIANIFKGPLAKHGNNYYYYGDNDYSTAQFGTQGYKTEDIGGGKYNIFGNNNNVLGVGYKSPREAIDAMWNARAPEGEQELWKVNDEFSGTFFRNADGSRTMPAKWIQQDEFTPGYWEGIRQEDLGDQGQRFFGTLPALQNPYVNSGGGTLEDWELLGQMLSGSKPTGYGSWGDVSKSGHNRFYSTNDRPESISGLNTLYGSSPLLFNDKLLGYKMNLNPNDATGDWGYQGPDKMGLSRLDRNGKTQSASSIWRELNNPDEWSKYGQRLDGSNFFVTPENADKLPGWTNKESNQYHQQKSGGFLGGGLGKIFSILGPALSFTPLAPVGYAMSAINGLNSLDQGNVLGGLASLFSAGMGLSSADLAGMAGVDQAVGGGFSGADLADFASPASALREGLAGIPGWALSGGVSGLSSAIQGNGFLPGAAGGALGNLISGGLGSMFDKASIGEALAKASGGAASRGIQSLFNQNQEIRGSEQAGRSGGLNAFLNTNVEATPQPSQEEKQQLAQELQRKLIQRKQQEMYGGA